MSRMDDAIEICVIFSHQDVQGSLVMHSKWTIFTIGTYTCPGNFHLHKL